MRFLHSSIFCAICTLIVGILLLAYPTETGKWLAVLLGILFIIPGIASVIMYYWNKTHGNTEHIEFPLAGWGSILLGIGILLIQAYEPQIIILVLGAILVILSISTVVNLLMNSKYWHIGVGNFVTPVVLFIIGVLVIVNYRVEFINDNSAIYTILGLSFTIYSIAELYYSIRVHSGKAKANKLATAVEESLEAPTANDATDNIVEESIETPTTDDAADGLAEGENDSSVNSNDHE